MSGPRAAGTEPCPSSDRIGSETARAEAEDGSMTALDNVRLFLGKNSLKDDWNASVLYQVHEDLRLVRKWTSMRVVKGTTRTYLAGTAARAYDSVFPQAAEGTDRTQVVIPISKSDMLSPQMLNDLCGECRHPETDEQLRCVTVAIVDDDSTTAYYRVFNKWEEIVHPQWKQKNKPSGNELENEQEERDVDLKEGIASDLAGSDSGSA